MTQSIRFFRLIIRVVLAIAVGLPSATIAATQHDSIAKPFITKQTGLQTAQSQITQPKLQAESIVVNQAGQTFFNHPPQLIHTAASQTGEYAASTYKFTLTVPQDAGQPLKAVAIAQVENLETVKFDINNSKAFSGTRLTSSSEIRLASVGGNQPANRGKITLVFDQPVEPGNTVTVALAVQSNPGLGGIYLFGVTAYPAGENGLGQFLGYGRISLDSNSN